MYIQMYKGECKFLQMEIYGAGAGEQVCAGRTAGEGSLNASAQGGWEDSSSTTWRSVFLREEVQEQAECLPLLWGGGAGQAPAPAP